MGKSAVLSIKIIGDASKAVSAMSASEKRTQSLQAGWKKLTVASTLVVGAGLAVAKSLESAGEAAGTSKARIHNIATSMDLFGDKTGEVTDRLVKVADKMALATAIDPNSIKQAQATLMTFKDVAITADTVGGTFDRATAASADLAGAGFGSIESASVMLGKALGDPTKGLSALSRVGVQFTDVEKEQIKTMQAAGDMAGAQSVILKGVEKQVGGTAEATADASEQQKIAWQLAREELGQKLLPVFAKFRDMGIAAAGWLGENSDLVIGLAAGIGGLAAAVLVINGAMKAWAVIQAIQTAAQWANNAAWLASPITWIILAVIAIIAILIAAIVLVVQNWDLIKEKAIEVWTIVITWIKSVIDWVKNKIVAAVKIAAAIWTNIRVAALAVFAAVNLAIQGAIDWVKNKIVAAVLIAAAIWVKIRDAAKTAFDGVVGAIKTAITWVKTTLGNAVEAAVTPFVTLKDGAVGALQSIIDWVKTAIDWISNLASNAIPGWAKDLLGMAKSAAMPVTPDLQALNIPTYQARMAVTPETGSFAAPAGLSMAGLGGLAFMAASPTIPPRARAAAATVVQQTTNNTFNFPNYVGDKRELATMLKKALKDLNIRSERLVTP